MKKLIFAGALMASSCSNEQPKTPPPVESNDQNFGHPDSIEVCCGGKCITVSWEMYEALDLASGTKGCAYVNDKLKD